MFIAAPIGSSGIEVRGAPAGWPPPQEYQTVFSTWVNGTFRPEYFHTSDAEEVPDFVGTTAGGEAPFSSISTLARVNGTRLVKIFSTSDPRVAVLPDVFAAGAEIVAQREWKAYPRYKAPEALGPFRLRAGLYYLNAIEAGASCIEISAIAGVNAALLAQQDWKGGAPGVRVNVQHRAQREL